MKKYLFLLFLAAGTAHAAPFANGDAENGKNCSPNTTAIVATKARWAATAMPSTPARIVRVNSAG